MGGAGIMGVHEGRPEETARRAIGRVYPQSELCAASVADVSADVSRHVSAGVEREGEPVFRGRHGFRTAAGAWYGPGAGGGYKPLPTKGASHGKAHRYDLSSPAARRRPGAVRDRGQSPDQ